MSTDIIKPIWSIKMIITFNRKEVYRVSDLDSFKDFLNDRNIIKNLKSLKNLDENKIGKIINFINSTKRITTKGVYIFLRSNNIFEGNSDRQIEYWYSRGYSIDESKSEVSNIQRKNSKNRLIKYTTEDFKRFSVRCKEYWMDKGYNEQDAILKVKEIQTTNSLDKLQSKYGERMGLSIRREITEKWQNTLKSKSRDEIDRINKTKSDWIRGKTYKEYFGLEESNKISETRRRYYIERIIKLTGSYHPNYNKDSIPIIEQYGKENGYNFQHAENGGEFHIRDLGYWVDAYDKEKNVVLEIDEEHHFKEDGTYIERDLIRQTQIINNLGCKFIRIKYEKNTDRNWQVIYSN